MSPTVLDGGAYLDSQQSVHFMECLPCLVTVHDQQCCKNLSILQQHVTIHFQKIFHEVLFVGYSKAPCQASLPKALYCQSEEVAEIL